MILGNGRKAILTTLNLSSTKKLIHFHYLKIKTTIKVEDLNLFFLTFVDAASTQEDKFNHKIMDNLQYKLKDECFFYLIKKRSSFLLLLQYNSCLFILSF